MPQYYDEKLNACALDRLPAARDGHDRLARAPLAVDLGDRVRALRAAPALCRARASPTWTSPGRWTYRLEEDHLPVAIGATDNGMGVNTILAQIPAEELQVELAYRGTTPTVSAVRRRLVRELGYVRDGPCRQERRDPTS